MTNPPATAGNHSILKSISSRYLTRFVPIIVVVFAVLIAIYGTVTYRESKADLASKLDTLMARQSLLLGEAVANRRDDRIGLLVAQTIADRDVASIAVLDRHGSVLNKYGPIPDQADPLVGRIAINHMGEDSYQRVGTLIVSMSDGPAIASLLNSLVYISLLGLALIASAAVAAHLVLRATVGQPLDMMLNAIHIQRDSGARIPIDWESEDQIGQVVAAYNALQDRQTRTEADLTRLRDKAERAHQSKSDFVARVIDEIRTPLNSIVGFSEIVSSRRFGPDTIQRYLSYAGNINQAARHLLFLIENVLELTRLEGGEIEPAFAPTPVASILSRAETNAASLPRNRDVRLRVSRDDTNPSLHVDGDLMVSLLGKLLENALRHAPEGGTVEMSYEAKPSGTACFTVTDPGPGIPEEQAESLLIPFSGSREFEDRGFHGSGLGLPICRILAELHGGAMEITNLAGGGLAASVLLPPSRTITPPPPGRSARGNEDARTDHYAAGAAIQHLNGAG
ncbi:sensor histidine kinase [Nisaea sp.]|uniref:sensor histidine kinase n=1 Tax=Nisaea sp. TaxID=2024842 RepID=UPI003B526840